MLCRRRGVLMWSGGTWSVRLARNTTLNGAVECRNQASDTTERGPACDLESTQQSERCRLPTGGAEPETPSWVGPAQVVTLFAVDSPQFRRHPCRDGVLPTIVRRHRQVTAEPHVRGIPE